MTRFPTAPATAKPTLEQRVAPRSHGRGNGQFRVVAMGLKEYLDARPPKPALTLGAAEGRRLAT
jgi:hypothetical protein